MKRLSISGFFGNAKARAQRKVEKALRETGRIAAREATVRHRENLRLAVAAAKRRVEASVQMLEGFSRVTPQDFAKSFGGGDPTRLSALASDASGAAWICENLAAIAAELRRLSVPAAEKALRDFETEHHAVLKGLPALAASPDELPKPSTRFDDNQGAPPEGPDPAVLAAIGRFDEVAEAVRRRPVDALADS
jgi:hypothetical protein